MSTQLLSPKPGTTGGKADAGRTSRCGLLCVARFPANTGYAWDFIEGLYRAVADELSELGVRTWVAYPQVGEPPSTLAGSAAHAVELDVDLASPRKLLRLMRFLHRERVRVLYMADHAAWHPAYALLRLAGIRWLVVHDHTSGERTIPRGLKRLLKLLRVRVPGMLADRVLAVSDFVARRKVEVDLVPTERVRRIWNSRSVHGRQDGAGMDVRRAFGLGDGPVIVCACRATAEKGVAHLLRAFDRYSRTESSGPARAALVYVGDGPDLPRLKALRNELASAGQIHMTGYRRDASDIVSGADICVVPSVWQEAFSLAALEPMTFGVPVIASRVGGIPEVVIDGETGLLVEPGDEADLADAIRRLLSSKAERRRLGENGLRRADALFSPERAISELLRELGTGLDGSPLAEKRRVWRTHGRRPTPE